MVSGRANIVASALAAGLLVSVSFALGQGQGQEPVEGKRASGPETGKAKDVAKKAETADRAGGPSFQFRGKPGDLAMLVREAPVQKELKLTSKQTAQLKESIAELDVKRRELIQNSMPGLPGPNGGGQAPPGNRQIVASSADPLAAESEQAIAEILEPRQMTRLRQIALQQEGLIAVAREEIADKINLSIPQREAIAAIQEDMRQAQQELMRSATGGTGVMMVQAKSKDKDGRPQLDKETMGMLQKMQEGREQIRKTGLQQINKLLTKKQGANFTKLMGEPFDFTTLSPLAQGKPMFLTDSLASAAQKKDAKDADKDAQDEPAARSEPSSLKPRKQGRSLRTPSNPDR